MLAAFFLVLVLTGCDAASDRADALVVEAFFRSDEQLADVRLQRTGALSGEAQDAPSDAQLQVRLGDRLVPYAHEREGWYRPLRPDTLAAGSGFTLEVTWSEGQARASGTAPPALAITDVDVQPAAEPVEIVMLDSLRFDEPIGEATLGYAYTVNVRLRWSVEEGGWWVRPVIKPVASGVSAVDDFLLRASPVVREGELSYDGDGLGEWTGVYAVPVERRTSPLPAHLLRVYLVRSGGEYARYAATRDDPQRREPSSNVEGGVGIAVAVAVDSSVVSVGGSR